MSALFLGSDSRRGRKRYRTEKVDLSFGYQLIASCIVKLFSSWVSRIPPTVLKLPAVRLLTNNQKFPSTSAGPKLPTPACQSSESYFHMIVCKPSALAIARMRSCDRGVCRSRVGVRKITYLHPHLRRVGASRLL